MWPGEAAGGAGLLRRSCWILRGSVPVICGQAEGAVQRALFLAASGAAESLIPYVGRRSCLLVLPQLPVRPNCWSIWEHGLVELLYWRDVKTTGVVFGASLLLLLSLTVCSIVSVCSYIGLALLSVTICFRIYKGILQAIQKSDEGHPFKQYLDQEVALSDDTVHKYSDVVLEKLNKTIEELRRLFLVEDLVDSIKVRLLLLRDQFLILARFPVCLPAVCCADVDPDLCGRLVQRAHSADPGVITCSCRLSVSGLIGAFSCPIIYEKHQPAAVKSFSVSGSSFKSWTIRNNRTNIFKSHKVCFPAVHYKVALYSLDFRVQAKVPGLKRKAE
ncbi:hypothetical protein XENOCAPTIV_021348 [Xenoophorus captivus]|uniref:Reticulon n=1 Tax=Xenoophorus captivus TaxID=1517983 RepID=A0ABV0QMG5_9TELE